ncbi:MAG: hypothetical protein ABW199_03800 [Caulobacterales bacterium]
MPALLVLVLGFAASLGAALIFFPDHFHAIAPIDIARVVYLLLLAVLVGSGLWGMRASRAEPAKPSRFAIYMLIWVALFIGGVVIYQTVFDFRGAT